MAGTIGRVLVFSLAEIRFVLDLDHLVEVLDQLELRLDSSRSDLRQGIVAALDFRHTAIPAVDPTLKLGLVSATRYVDRVALVLRGSEGNWAVLVDQIEGLMPADALVRATLPVLLKATPEYSDAQVMLADGVPLVVFEPERFYGINQGVA
ncbi:MAG: chemotaxis protein CheW [Pelovirga sp.]